MPPKSQQKNRNSQPKFAQSTVYKANTPVSSVLDLAKPPCGCGKFRCVKFSPKFKSDKLPSYPNLKKAKTRELIKFDNRPGCRRKMRISLRQTQKMSL